LFGRVVAINAGVLIAAALLLALSPATVSSTLELAEAAVLALGTVLMISVNLLLLRRVFGPLEQLTAVMRRIDPHAPGRRLALDRADAEVADLCHAFNAMLDRLEDERRTSSGRALAAQENERRRLARELHDEVGQALTTVKINLDTMRIVGADDPEAQAELLEDGVQLVGRALEQVRDLSLLLHPAMLDHLGLEAALRWLLHSQAQRAGYQVTYTAAPLAPPPAPAAALICYRVAQEALTNVARHARATHVRLDLRDAAGWLQLTVADDGAGFDPARMRERARHGGSMGLLSLQERAALGRGHLRIDSAPGRGTTLTLRLPPAGPRAAPAPLPGPAP
jgi:two-component system sensor histidine kinase UhpB